MKRLIHVKSDKIFIKSEDLFDIKNEVHIEKAHSERDGMLNELKNIYENITRSDIEMYLASCEFCFLRTISQGKVL